MSDFGNWILMLISAVIGVLGLILASRAADTGMYVAGLLFFVFGVVFCFSQMNALLAAGQDED